MSDDESHEGWFPDDYKTFPYKEGDVLAHLERNGQFAKIRGLNAADALRRIAETKTPFVSRGDQSGTHVCELAIWKRAGIEPKGQFWYRETGKAPGLTMEVASQLQAYAFTDRGSYLVLSLVLVKRTGLRILVENDSDLSNIYHVMPVNTAKFPKVNLPAGQAFADWVVSSEGQAVIAAFGKKEFGRSLFMPAATMREDDFSPRLGANSLSRAPLQ